MGVRHVYCWHALHGYWRGASESLGTQNQLSITQAQPRPSRHLLTLEPQLAYTADTGSNGGHTAPQPRSELTVAASSTSHGQVGCGDTLWDGPSHE